LRVEDENEPLYLQLQGLRILRAW